MTESLSTNSVLLVFPPFSPTRFPYSSLPVLAAWLRARGKEVRMIDANVEFFDHLLTPEKLAESRRRVEERFLELNGKPQLAERQEMNEYAVLTRTLARLHAVRDDLPFLFNGRDPAKRASVFFTAAATASLPYWPEYVTLDAMGMNIRYRSGFSPYSTRGVMQSLEREGMLSGFFEKLLYPILERERPQVVGLSVAFPTQMQAALRCAKVIKRKYPRLFVVMGGAFPTCCMREIREPQFFAFLDGIVLGDGEKPLEALMQEVAGGRPDLERVPGLIWFADGKIRRNAPAPFMRLETLPPPDYSGLDLDRYLVPRDRIFLPLRSSRGCAWARCAFCRTELELIHRHELLAAEQVLANVKSVIDSTGVNRISFTDEAGSPALMAAFSRRALAEQLRLSWAINIRFDRRITFDQAELFHAAGCRYINGGIEVYNDRLLRLIRKGIATRTIDEILSNTACAGIESMVYMMVGLPTETVAEARKGFAVVKRMKRTGVVSSFRYGHLQILPNSAMASEPEKFGITRLVIPEDPNLAGVITEFDCAGMPRRKAQLLAAEFNGMQEKPQAAVPIGNREIPLRHDLLRIRDVLLQSAGEKP